MHRKCGMAGVPGNGRFQAGDYVNYLVDMGNRKKS